MSDATELSADVVAEIRANRKIQAIKLMREQRGIGLKEAKEIVDDYMAQLPPGTVKQSQRADTGVRRMLLVAAGATLIYLLYSYLT